MLVFQDLVVYVIDMSVQLLLVEVVFKGVLCPDLEGVYDNCLPLYGFPVLEKPYELPKGQFEGLGIVLSEVGDFPCRGP